MASWLQEDSRRMLHAVYRVGDMDKTIKWYQDNMGMKLLRYRDIPEGKYSNAFLGYGDEREQFVLEVMRVGACVCQQYINVIQHS